MTIVFCGGGTGGHIYPGLAVAEELRRVAGDTALRICWVGSPLARDRSMVEANAAVDEFYPVAAGKLRRYFSWQTFLDAFKVLIGFFQSLVLLAKLKPAALFSKGGYVSVPPCFAARLLGISVYAHEADVSPGLATQLTAKLSTALFVSYGETLRFLPAAVREKAVVSGNPIREAMYHGEKERGLAFLFQKTPSHREKPLLLVLGGSLGARQINHMVEENLDWLTESYVVVHQTGAEAPAEASPSYVSHSFFHGEIADVIAASDLVLTRAGASALWECAVAGKGMVLLPLGLAGSRGDQLENARLFEDAGAALVLSGAETGEELREALGRLSDAAVRRRMGEAAKRMCPGKPARVIAEYMWRGIGESSGRSSQAEENPG